MSLSIRHRLPVFLMFVAPLLTVGAQTPAVRPPSGPGVVRGTAVDNTQQPLTTGSVTIRKAADKSFLTGSLIGADGRFRVEGLMPGSYVVGLRSLGVAPVERTIEITPAATTVDLGTVVMTRVAATLSAQTTVVERSEVLSPDRNTFSVRNLPAAAGGNSVDALRGTPGVEVDANDRVSLRGNGNVVVQINGRATPLSGEQLTQFLKQIPASAVDKIEVATNPSAKNDPEGTAGIINLILKQDVDIGFSAGFNVGMGTTGMLNASGNVAEQRGPWSYYASVFGNRDERRATTTLDRQNIAVASPAFLEALTGANQHPRGGGLNLKAEYRFTKKDILTSEGFLFRNVFNAIRSADYQELNAGSVRIGAYGEVVDRNITSSSQDLSLTFRHTVSPQLTPFVTELHYSSFGNDNDDFLTSTVSQASPTTLRPGEQRDVNRQRFPSLVWQTDVTKSVSPKFKFEGGTKATWRRTNSAIDWWRTDTTSGVLVARPDLSNAFNYREQFDAIYGVFSEKAGKVTFQQGLRAERTWSHIEQRTASGPGSAKNSYSSFFPSAIVTFAPSPFRQAKLSFSRRISRPFPGSLSPVPFQVDQRTIQVGNPSLKPEYTNAYELSLQSTHGWGTVQLTPYVRQTTNQVRFLRTVDSLGVSTSRPANLAEATQRGAEFNASLRRGPGTLSVGGNTYQYSNKVGSLGAQYAVSTHAWNARANGSLKLNALTTMQVFSFYRPATRQEGGSTLASAFVGGGIRRSFEGGKGNISLNVQDPFKWNRFGQRLDDGRVIELNETRFTSRALVLSISRTYGQNIRFHQRETESDQPPAQTP